MYSLRFSINSEALASEFIEYIYKTYRHEQMTVCKELDKLQM